MAAIELRDANIYILDGLSGTGAINVVSPTTGATSLAIDAVALNTTVATLVPIGARFTIAGETGSPIHTVLTRTPTSSGPTTAITFSVSTAAGVLDNAVITFLPQRILVKVGDGNITYTEAREIEYVLNRGVLDGTREGDDQPLAVNLQFVYEFVRTGTNLVITPSDAIKGIGGASGWVSSDVDTCAPFACNISIEYVPTCSGTPTQSETTLFEAFRWDSLQFDLSAASIAVQGRCNRTEATVTRL